MSQSPEHPDDFIYRYEDAAARLLDRIERACAAETEWSHGVRSAIVAALAFLAAEPATGRLLLFEPYGSGREGQSRHEATLARLADLLRGGREQGVVAPLPELVEEDLLGALAFLVGRPLNAGQPDLLPALAPELTALVLTPYLGREEAERVAGLSDRRVG